MVADDDGIQYGGDQYFTAAGLPPVVTTLDATHQALCIDCAPNVVLNGTVNGNDTPIVGYFGYGLDTNNGVRTPPSYGPANSSLQAFSDVLTGANLTPGATYHYRIHAFNAADEPWGADKTFVAPGGR